MDINNYYSNIARVGLRMADGDPDWRESTKEIFLTGLRHGNLIVTTAKPALAAICIIENTHRESTTEEIAAWKAHQVAEAERIRHEDREMKGRNAPPPSAELKAMLETMTSQNVTINQMMATMAREAANNKPSKGSN